MNDQDPDLNGSTDELNALRLKLRAAKREAAECNRRVSALDLELERLESAAKAPRADTDPASLPDMLRGARRVLQDMLHDHRALRKRLDVLEGMRVATTRRLAALGRDVGEQRVHVGVLKTTLANSRVET